MNNNMLPNLRFFSSAYYYFFFLGHFNRQMPQLCTAARHLTVTTSRSFVNVPLKDYIILFAPFFPSAHFSVFILFLPRDNWLIHQCITPPPPDPQHHQHTFPEPFLVWHGWHHHHSAAVSSLNWIVYWHQFFLSIFSSPPHPPFFLPGKHASGSASPWFHLELMISVCWIVCRLRCLCHLVAEFRKGHLDCPLRSRLWLHYGRKGDTAEHLKKKMF